MAAPVTIILGLGRDAGAACGRVFLEAGHHVVLADPSAERLEKANDALSGRAAIHHSELHTHLGVRNALASATEVHGRVDHLVILPPVPKAAGLMEMDAEQINGLSKSARSGALALKLFAETLDNQDEEGGVTVDRARQRGSATFVLSLSAQLSDPGRFNEAVAQNAVLGVMRAGALDLADRGIRCNAIAAVRPRAETGEPWLKQRTPLGRAALADEIAEAALFLSSPSAAIITGETLTLDGGRRALNGLLGG